MSIADQVESVEFAMSFRAMTGHFPEPMDIIRLRGRMNKRPLSVTIIGGVYVLTGVIGLAKQIMDFRGPSPLHYDVMGIGLIHLIAVLCGVYMFRGHDWARWIAIAWMAFHVIVSAFNSTRELILHSLICAILAYFLFRPTAARYFRPAGTAGAV